MKYRHSIALLIVGIFCVNSILGDTSAQFQQLHQPQQHSQQHQIQGQQQQQPTQQHQQIQQQHRQQNPEERGDLQQQQYAQGQQYGAPVGQVGQVGDHQSGVQVVDHGISGSGPAGVWQEGSYVATSAWSSAFGTLSEMFVNLGVFQMLVIPAILLTGVYMIWVAYTSPYNAQSHYLVDSVPGQAPSLGLGGLFGGGNGWKRSLNSFAAKTIDELTPKVLTAIKDFTDKH